MAKGISFKQIEKYNSSYEKRVSEKSTLYENGEYLTPYQYQQEKERRWLEMERLREVAERRRQDEANAAKLKQVSDFGLF